MDKLKLTVRVLCIIPFFTGVADILYGEGLQYCWGEIGERCKRPRPQQPDWFLGCNLARLWFHPMAGKLAFAR